MPVFRRDEVTQGLFQGVGQILYNLVGQQVVFALEALGEIERDLKIGPIRV